MNIKKFKARTGAPFKEVDAQVIGEFVFNVENKTTNNILKEIKKHPKHPIAKCIEWNDKLASKNYRLQQVRNIVNHIMIDVETVGNNLPMRVFYSVKEKIDSTPIYMDFENVSKNEFALQQIIDRAKSELENWLIRYNQYKALQKISIVIKNELEK